MLLYILTGLIIKTIFNIPFMYSFQEMGLHAGYGAITATILGFSVSIVLILRRLHKEIGINYEETITRLISILYACLVMTIVILLLQFIMPINMTNRVSALLVATIYSIIGIVVYLFVTIKQGLLAKIFGESFGNKILVKLKLKKD
jgi:peptidoglycan biosynthesis protein MviN/MurJ (putative lipid II flippase)